MLDPLKRMAALAAARQLRTSTSAVSQQVRALEKDMGVTLLHRSTRKLSLTPAGERFHAGCVGFGRRMGPALAPRTVHTSLYAAPAYLAQRGVPATPEALQAADWLVLQDGTDPPRRLPGSQLRVQPRYTSNNPLTLQQLCEAGLGLAGLGEEDLAESVAAGRLLRLDTPPLLPELPVWAMTLQRDAQPAQVRHAIAALKAHLADAAR